MHVTVSVTLRDGTTHTERCDRPPGTWGAPIDRRCTARSAQVASAYGCGERTSMASAAIIDRFEEAAAEDIEDLIRLLRNAAVGAAGPQQQLRCSCFLLHGRSAAPRERPAAELTPHSYVTAPKSDDVVGAFISTRCLRPFGQHAIMDNHRSSRRRSLRKRRPTATPCSSPSTPLWVALPAHAADLSVGRDRGLSPPVTLAVNAPNHCSSSILALPVNQ